jgi:hypothetical protein
MPDGKLMFRTELVAAYERISELKSVIAELVGTYWGSGDNIDPPPQCIQRAKAALSEEVR